MITKELTDYIKNKLAQGVTREALVRLLTANGWEQDDIIEGFEFFKPVAPAAPLQAEILAATQPVQPAAVIPTAAPVTVAPVQQPAQFISKPQTTPPVQPVVNNIVTPKVAPPSTPLVKKIDPQAPVTSIPFQQVKTAPPEPPPLAPTSNLRNNPLLIKNSIQPSVLPPQFRNLAKPQPAPTPKIITPVQSIQKPTPAPVTPSLTPAQKFQQSYTPSPTQIPIQKVALQPAPQPVAPKPATSTFTSSIPVPVPPKAGNTLSGLKQSLASLGGGMTSTSARPATAPVAATPSIKIEPVKNNFATPVSVIPNLQKPLPVQPAAPVLKTIPPTVVPQSGIVSGPAQKPSRPVPVKPTVQTTAPAAVKAAPILAPIPPMASKTSLALNGATATAAPVKPMHSKRVMKTLITVFVALVLLGGGAYAYFFQLKNPTHIEGKVSAALDKIQSFNFSATADVSVLSTKNGAETDNSSSPTADHFIFKSDGAYDESDISNPKLDANVSVTAPVLFDKPYSLKIKMIGETAYLSLPPVGLLELVMPKELTPQDGTWLLVTGEDLKTLALQKPSLSNIAVDGDGQPRTAVFSVNEIKQIKKIMSDASIVELTDKTGSDSINNTLADHYHFTVNATSFFKAISKIKKDVFGLTAAASSADEIAAQIQNTRISGGDIWIGQEDSLPYKIIFTIENLNPISREVEITTAITVVLSNYNGNVTIEVPKNVTAFADILAKMQTNNPQSNAKNLLSAALQSAQTFSEKNDGHFNGICGSKNGFLDLLTDAGKKNGGVKPRCNSAKDGWIIWMQYGTDKNTYVCLDSTGVDKVTSGPIIGITCPIN